MVPLGQIGFGFAVDEGFGPGRVFPEGDEAAVELVDRVGPASLFGQIEAGIVGVDRQPGGPGREAGVGGGVPLYRGAGVDAGKAARAT